jgi:hypothetical protein
MQHYTRTFPKRKDMYRCLFPKGSVGVEVGVQHAQNARVLFDTVRPTELHLVDGWSAFIWGHKPREPFVQSFWDDAFEAAVKVVDDLGPAVKMHRGVSVNIAETFPDNYFDWVYVDADHIFDSLMSDWVAWFPKIKNGGVFSGHDFSFCPVSCDKFHFPGIKRAVHRMLYRGVCVTRGLEGYCELIGFTREHCRSFALQIIK